MEWLFGLVVAVGLGLRWVYSNSEKDQVAFDEEDAGYQIESSTPTRTFFHGFDADDVVPASESSWSWLSLLSSSSSSSSWSSSLSESSPSWPDFHSGPSMNIDGTPMIGDSVIDIHGNSYGITND